tara:strand:- start:27 stop:404 length:378 start_codon:yes stop_codon:yes gene_type:complete
MATRRKIKSGFKRAGGLFGLGSPKDLGNVVITSLGSNQLANYLVALSGRFGTMPYMRPIIAGLIGYVISSRSKRNATALGSLFIALAQSGGLGMLSGLTGGSSGTNNPARGQQKMTSLNVLGRLP